MSTDEKDPLKMIGFRIPESKWRRLKICLAHNGTTAQESLSGYVDRYLAHFEPEMQKPLAEPVQVKRGGPDPKS